MKRKLIMILLSLSLFCNGCADISYKETQTVMAEVVDVKYQPSFKTPYWNPATKSMSYILHPEDYDIYIKYQGTTYILDSKEAYLLCDDLVGQNIECQYEMIYYDDGTIETYITIGGFR